MQVTSVVSSMRSLSAPTPPLVVQSQDRWDASTQASQARDAALMASALTHQAAPARATHGRAWRSTNNILLGLSIGALLVQGAAAFGSPSPRPATNSGGGCSPFGTWAFADGFDIMVTACCKQVNPIRQMFNRINACGDHTQPAASPAGIFAGSIGKPSDCPDSNVDAVYTAALYVSEVVQNSTAFTCLMGLFNNPGQGAL